MNRVSIPAIALAAMLTLSVPATASDRVQDGFFSYDFEQDLKTVLDPNPPEPPSLPPMWPRITIPALSTQQVEKLVLGNTIRRDDDVAVYFAPEGALEGWIDDWAVAEKAKCSSPDRPGDAVRRHAGRCEMKTTIPATGTWQARNNAVCVELRMSGESKKECWYLAIVTDRVALFDESGDMLGALKVLKAGRVLDQLGD